MASLCGSTPLDGRSGDSVSYLNGTQLDRAHLNSAHLNGASLWGAHLNGAHLNGADITQGQLDAACGADATLPAGLTLKPCP